MGLAVDCHGTQWVISSGVARGVPEFPHYDREKIFSLINLNLYTVIVNLIKEFY